VTALANIRHDFSMSPSTPETLELEIPRNDGLLISLECVWLLGQVGGFITPTGYIHGRSTHTWFHIGAASGGVVHLNDDFSGLAIVGGHTIAGGVVTAPDSLPDRKISLTVTNASGSNALAGRLRAERLTFSMFP